MKRMFPKYSGNLEVLEYVLWKDGNDVAALDAEKKEAYSHASYLNLPLSIGIAKRLIEHCNNCVWKHEWEGEAFTVPIPAPHRKKIKSTYIS